jgi:cytochrome c oxidase cbb3-type subunit 1
MERFVKNFIGASIVYLGISVILGVLMLLEPSLLRFRFVHSHLMLLGWVSMMIYGVGYHILPRFAGKFIKSKTLGELQFYLSNIGLIGMLFFYILMDFGAGAPLYRTLTVLFASIEGISIFMFVYNMIATLYGKAEEAGH